MLKLREGFQGERSIVLPEMIVKTCADDPLLSQLYITDMGYYPHAAYHYRERPKGVRQHILIYCVRGSGWYSVGGRRHEVRADQWFVIPKGAPHVYASNNSDPWTIYWVHFAGTMAPLYITGDDAPKDIPSAKTSRISDRLTMFEEIFLTLSDGYGLDNMRYASSLLYGFLATFRYLHHFRKYNSLSERIDSDDVVATAVRFLHENMEKQLSLSEMAEYTGYSASHFSLIFRNSTGQSPLTYFNKLKIERACLLLESTDMKINQICSKVGIEDCYYFSRLFAKIVGVPPKKYRESMRKNAAQ